MKYIFTLCDPAYISMLLLNILVNTNDKKEYKFINKLTLGQTLFEKITGVKNSHSFFSVLQVRKFVNFRCLTVECASYL